MQHDVAGRNRAWDNKFDQPAIQTRVDEDHHVANTEYIEKRVRAGCPPRGCVGAYG